jgi:PepSY-associated TM region
MGAAFCILFAWWFLSGFVMMYWDYPGVDAAGRLAHSPVLDPSRIQLSPAAAFDRLGTGEPPQEVRLTTLAGRPAYRFRMAGTERIVYADSGERPELSSKDLNLRIAAAWTGQTATAASVELNTEEDQWTVAEAFQPLRPLWKFSWPNGEQVYVSTVTGEVVQYTTPGSRLGAWLGAIPHCLYFTPLRKNLRLWTTIVIWSSGLATIAALLGLAAGISMYSPSKRYKYDGAPTGIPYRGQKRWHTLCGLFFGILACTWAFSGMLSMNPFPLPIAQHGDAAMSAALRGRPFTLTAFAAKDPRQAISNLKVKELDLTFLAGQPVYLAIGGRHGSRMIPVSKAFDPNLNQVIREAALPTPVAELRVLEEYDVYYLDRHREKPLPVILARLDDSQRTRYYIDPQTARIVGSYRTSSFVDRWLYQGLHSIDLPWLYNHRPAWDLVVLVLLLGGASLSITGVILGFQLLRRTL